VDVSSVIGDDAMRGLLHVRPNRQLCLTISVLPGAVHDDNRARFVMVPLTANIAASFPVNLAIRSSSSHVDESSP